jgi:hypothetical protein
MRQDRKAGLVRRREQFGGWPPGQARGNGKTAGRTRYEENCAVGVDFKKQIGAGESEGKKTDRLDHTRARNSDPAFSLTQIIRA